MARPYKAVRSVAWKLRIPYDLAAAIEEMFLNPLTGRPGYGEKSDLVVTLLRKYLDEQTAALAQLQENRPK